MATQTNWELYYVISVIGDPKRSITVLRGFDAPKLVSVGGRWNVVERPRKKSLVQWAGDDPYRMSLPILFDGFDHRESQDAYINTLNKMRLSAGDSPPRVKVTGALPVDNPTDGWVIESIDWGDNVIWSPGGVGRGFRIRQDATVNLLEYVAPDVVKVRSTDASFIYTVKKGDTLSKISNLWYGTPKYASMLKKVNKIRDAKKLPKQLRIPPIVKASAG